MQLHLLDQHQEIVVSGLITPYRCDPFHVQFTDIRIPILRETP